MNIRLIILALLLSPFFIANAQVAESSAKVARTTINLEFGGNGLLGTLNWDSRFGRRPDGIGLRAGFGGFVVNGSGWFAVPIHVNYLAGDTAKGNYFEAGFGGTLVGGDLFELLDTGGLTGYGNLVLGFRLQPPEGGFGFRAVVTPMFGVDSDDEIFFIPWIPGLSFGYVF